MNLQKYKFPSKCVRFASTIKNLPSFLTASYFLSALIVVQTKLISRTGDVELIHSFNVTKDFAM